MGVPFTTVADHLRRANEAGLAWPLPDGLDDAALEALLFPRTGPGHGPARAGLRVHRSSGGPGVTLMLLWLEYKEAIPTATATASSVFTTGSCSATWTWSCARSTGPVRSSSSTSPARGSPSTTGHRRAAIEAELFVAVLGASNYLYAEAFPPRSCPTGSPAHVHAFEFFGAVPRSWCPTTCARG